MAKENRKVRIFSALEVANICGVVNQTAINWIKSGYLKAFTTPGGQYRVYSDDLHRFLVDRGMRIPVELEDALASEQRPRKLLIVDDDRELNNLLRKFLTRSIPEYEIGQAYDGFEAGRLLAESKPGVVILDINLPGVDGHRLCQTMKSDPSLGNPIVVAISGLSDPDTEASILREGADSFLAKPLDLESLASRIRALADARP
jgi:two-component system, OmpR family, response regulator